MSRLLLLLPLIFLLAGCGRMYTLIGKVVFLEVPKSSISEVKSSEMPNEGIAIVGARVTLYHELLNNQPKRDSVWIASRATDANGNFHLKSYAEPSIKSLAGLEVIADGYETVFTTYVDYAEPDEQYFYVVLRKGAQK